MAVSGTPSTTRWDYERPKTCGFVLNGEQSIKGHEKRERWHTDASYSSDVSIFY
jgi:hypothetical protein